MALIYELANPIGINDTHVTFRIKDHLDADLTTTADGIKLVNAVDYMNSDFTYNLNDIGTILTIRNFAYTLGHGYEAGGFNYDGYFQALSSYSDNSGDWFDYRQGTLYTIASKLRDSFPASNYFTGNNIAFGENSVYTTHWGNNNNNYTHCPVESIIWEDENYSVSATFPLPSNPTYMYWEQDSVKVTHWSHLWEDYAEDTGFDVTMGDAPFVGQLPTSPVTQWVNINKEDFYGFEGCIGAIFSILDVSASSDPTELIRIYPTSEVPEIHDSSFSQVVCLQPYVWGEAPEGSEPLTTYNFALSITDVNIPSVVVENETAECSFKVTSTDFNGAIRAFVAGYEPSEMVDYGDVSFTDPNFGIGSINAGEQIDITFTYTASDVGTQQTDYFYVFVEMVSLNQTYYGDDGANALNQFDQLSNFLTWSDTPHITIIQEGQNVEDVFIPSDVAITKPSDVIYHLVKQELGYDKYIDDISINESRTNHDNWNLGFCINKEIDSKKLIQEISQSSKSFPTFSNDRLKFITIKSTYRGGSEYYDENIIEEITTINNTEVIKYNFSRTKIEDVKTQVEVKHKYDYGLKNHIETTGEIKINEHYVVNNAYWLTGTYGDLIEDTFTFNNYYGIKRTDTTIDHIDTFLTVENDYIRSSELAERFARYLLYWHMNQHNIVELTLPLKYFALEI